MQRSDVGQPQGTVSFSPDGLAAFVTVPAKNEVAVIDMAALAVAERIATGGQPFGLVILDPVAGPENLPAVTPASGSGGPASLPPVGWLLTLGGAAVFAGLRLRRRSQIEYRRLDEDQT